MRPLSKITRAKRAGGMAQAVEHLPSKCDTLSSNPRTTKKKKKIPPARYKTVDLLTHFL
jgi:hypothetical protein